MKERVRLNPKISPKIEFRVHENLQIENYRKKLPLFCLLSFGGTPVSQITEKVIDVQIEHH